MPVPHHRLRMTLLFGTLAVFASGAHADDLRQIALDHFEPLPHRIDKIRDLLVTKEKVTLGKMLFFDPRLSDTGETACASCHNPATGGDSNVATSVGHAWQSAPQNAPTVFNATLNTARFWQGWAEDMKTDDQYFLHTGAERTASPERVVSVLSSMPAYVEAFEAAFPQTSDPVTFGNYAAALEQFETTLLTPAPFDSWLRGDDAALSDDARAGLRLFIDSGCADCHRGVNLGGNGYYPFRVKRVPGTEADPESSACFTVVEDEEAQYLYRAGSLRNVAVTAPYFSEGSVWSLDLAVELMARSQLSTELADADRDLIVAFLNSLTGQPPAMDLPALPTESLLTPRPAP